MYHQCNREAYKKLTTTTNYQKIESDVTHIMIFLALLSLVTAEELPQFKDATWWNEIRWNVTGPTTVSSKTATGRMMLLKTSVPFVEIQRVSFVKINSQYPGLKGYGGAIYIEHGEIACADSAFENCYSMAAGAVAIFDCSSNFGRTNCTYCRSQALAGAMLVGGCDTFQYIHEAHGDDWNNVFNFLNLVECRFEGCKSTFAGALAVTNVAECFMTSITITQCVAYNDCGSLLLHDSNLVLKDSRINNNCINMTAGNVTTTGTISLQREYFRDRNGVIERRADNILVMSSGKDDMLLDFVTEGNNYWYSGQVVLYTRTGGCSVYHQDIVFSGLTTSIRFRSNGDYYTSDESLAFGMRQYVYNSGYPPLKFGSGACEAGDLKSEDPIAQSTSGASVDGDVSVPVQTIPSWINTETPVSSPSRIGNLVYGTTLPNPHRTPTSVFTPSSVFSPSREFAVTKQFTQSGIFTNSNKFVATNLLSPSNQFTGTAGMSPSSRFSQSKALSKSDAFTSSAKPTGSHAFTASGALTATGLFSSSNLFTATAGMSASSRFSQSKAWTKSDAFTSSAKPTGSHAFTASGALAATRLFSSSNLFTATAGMSASKEFLKSDPFSPSNQLSHSQVFTVSGHFSTSDVWTKSNAFSSSCQLSQSQAFTPSGALTATELFSSSASFTYSAEMSPSGQFDQSNAFSPSSDIPASDEFSDSGSFISTLTLIPELNLDAGPVLGSGGIAAVVVSSVLVIVGFGIVAFILIRRNRVDDFMSTDEDDSSTELDPEWVTWEETHDHDVATLRNQVSVLDIWEDGNFDEDFQLHHQRYYDARGLFHD